MHNAKHSRFSRRAVVGLPIALTFGRIGRSQDFTVDPKDAEKAARSYLSDLVRGGASRENFWYYDRTFNLELAKLNRADPKSLQSLKNRWTATIAEDRRSKTIDVEAFANSQKDPEGWKKRHPKGSDPEYLCWLVFLKNVQLNSVSAREKEANFNDEKIWVHIPFHYENKNQSPLVHDLDLNKDMRLQNAEATLWVQKPARNAHLYVYDECWLSDITYWP
jgi:hypothetical protein